MTERTIAPLTSALAFVGLVILTVATVSLSFLRMGPAGHLAVGLLFGAAKAALVALVFMHLVRSPARTWLAAGVGLFWLGILVVLTLNDYLTRASATF
jgi:cytochrome c oxidase subunit 4